MSRRKQLQPKHIETKDENTVLIPNGETLTSPLSQPAPEEPHICEKCQEVLPNLETYMSHKESCESQKVQVFFDPNDTEPIMSDPPCENPDDPPPVDGGGVGGEGEGEVDIKEPAESVAEGGEGQGCVEDTEENPCEEIGQFSEKKSTEEDDDDGEESSMGLNNMEMGNEREDRDDDEDEDDVNEDDLEDMEDHINEEELEEDVRYMKMLGRNLYQEQVEEDEDDDEENDDEDGDKDGDRKLNGAKDFANVPNLMLNPFSPFLSNTSNVVLEPMSATKAAVAQFAENNVAPADMAVLQSTLYTLQQQQLVQMQLIHQLQQQILLNMPSPPTTSSSSSSPSSSTNANQPLMPPPELAPSTSHPLKELTSCIKSAGLALDSLAPSKSLARSSEGGNEDTATDKVSRTSSDASPTSSKAIPTSQLLPGNNSSSGSKTPSSSEPSDFARLSMLVERSQYASDDPFFRHKCRLCGKVFGSDSALQIHIRSHTGERPFKCNVCGNRFSTRGNMKVHFERHKAKYPHIKMNPNPVPEYLDKTPGMSGPPFPGGIPPPLPLSSRMLNPLPPPPPPPVPHHSGMNPSPSSSLGMLGSSLHMSRHIKEEKDCDREKHREQDRERERERERERDRPRERERRPSSPTSLRSPSSTGRNSTLTASEAPERISPKVSDTANMMVSSAGYNFSPLSRSLASSFHSDLHKTIGSPFFSAVGLSSPLLPPIMSHPLMTSLPSLPPNLPPPPPPLMSTIGFDQQKDTILPSKMIDHNENLEQYMEIDKSETSKLQQLVDNLENKVSDPNQCVICHRVLSCKSALQMHYRIHTGERPFKCKICGRAFTTKGNLKTHMGVHRMKPPLRMMHQCPVCHKSFTNLLVLQQHIRSHAGMHGLQPIPDLTHMHMFQEMHAKEWAQKPFDLSLKMEPERELDLSRAKRPRLDDRMESPKEVTGVYTKEEMEKDLELNGDDLVDNDEEMDYAQEKDYSGEEHPSHDSGAGSEEGRTSSMEEQALKRKLDSDRPKSNSSSISNDSGRSPSPKYIGRSPHNDNDQGLPQFNPLSGHHSTPVFNPSLAALEERVRAIDTSMNNSPLNNFRPIFSMPGLGPSHFLNGHMSPGSPENQYSGDSCSENGEDGGESKPGTPALSYTSEGGSSIGSGGYMMPGMDMRDDSKKNTTCNICFKVFACRSALDIHYRSHTKERPFKCKCCDRSFTTKGNMKQHMLTHKIRDLPKTFSGSETNSNDGSRLGDNNNSVDATDMENKSVTDDLGEDGEVKDIPNIKNSSASFSSIALPVSSSSVGSSSSSSSSAQQSNDTLPVPSGSSNNRNLSPSNNSNNNSDSPFVRQTPLKHQCQVCNKGFSSQSALQIHHRTHTGDKPFKCTVCGKAFTTKGNLKVHMGTHMWNNSPSRRGRRMSIEPPFMMAHKENPYIPPGFPHRSPDFFPYQFPPFMNGVGSHKMNEISVIQNMAAAAAASGGLIPPPMGLHPDLSPQLGKLGDTTKRDHVSRSPEVHLKASGSGELDLSMKSSQSRGSPSPNGLADKMPAWSSSGYMPGKSMDHHMSPFHLQGESQKSVVA